MQESRSSPDPALTNELVPGLYEELKRIARHQLSLDDATLCTTELVHEAYLKLGGTKGWEGRAHFFGAASRAMRQVLVEFARRRLAAKRGSGVEMVSLGGNDAALDVELDEIIALDDALERLNGVDERLRKIVELRFFAGLEQEEIARMLGVSTRTVERDWLKARMVLLDALARD